MLRAGIDDWVAYPDHRRPRQPGAAVAGGGRATAQSLAAGFTMRERLTAYPATCWPARRGSTPGCTPTWPRWPTRRPGWPARAPRWSAAPGRSPTRLLASTCRDIDTAAPPTGE